jgi:hypothetical protein
MNYLIKSRIMPEDSKVEKAISGMGESRLTDGLLKAMHDKEHAKERSPLVLESGIVFDVKKEAADAKTLDTLLNVTRPKRLNGNPITSLAELQYAMHGSYNLKGEDITDRDLMGVI